MFRKFISMCLFPFLALLAHWSYSQTPMPLYVSFEIRVPAISNGLGEDSKTVEQQISQSLAESLSESIKLWTFQKRQDGQYPWIRIYVEERDSDLIMSMDLVPSAQQPEELLLSKTWLTSEDLDATGYPVPEPVSVRKFFETKMLIPNRTMLQEKLQSFPIGPKVEFLTPPPPKTIDEARGVLPLDWNSFCWLSMSYFRIEARTPTKVVEIECKGDGVHSPYVGAGYNGLVVEYTKYGGDEIATHLQDLKDVQMRNFFLVRMVATGFSDCSQDAVQPTIAPQGEFP